MDKLDSITNIRKQISGNTDITALYQQYHTALRGLIRGNRAVSYLPCWVDVEDIEQEVWLLVCFRAYTDLTVLARRALIDCLRHTRFPRLFDDSAGHARDKQKKAYDVRVAFSLNEKDDISDDGQESIRYEVRSILRALWRKSLPHERELLLCLYEGKKMRSVEKTDTWNSIVKKRIRRKLTTIMGEV